MCLCVFDRLGSHKRSLLAPSLDPTTMSAWSGDEFSSSDLNRYGGLWNEDPSMTRSTPSMHFHETNAALLQRNLERETLPVGEDDSQAFSFVDPLASESDRGLQHSRFV